MSERVFMKGGEAVAEALIRAGCRFYAGYPITPQNEIPEYLSRRLPEVGGVFIQGESEIASVNMVYGAACTGTRSVTSSSSPGISLKTEGISYMAMAKIPALVVSVQRGGPGCGSIQPSQQDYWQATKALGNGGNKHIVFAPATIQETVDLMETAFQKAERDRNPVVMLIDGCICSLMEPVTLPEMVKPKLAGSDWRLEGHADQRPGRRIIPFGTEDFVEEFNRELLKMEQAWDERDTMVEELYMDDAEIVVTAYGTCARIVLSAVQQLRGVGHKIGMIRPIVVNPFPKAAYNKLDPTTVKLLIDIELAIPCQMVDDVMLALPPGIPVNTFGRTGGNIPTDGEVRDAILELIEEGEAQ